MCIQEPRAVRARDSALFIYTFVSKSGHHGQLDCEVDEEDREGGRNRDSMEAEQYEKSTKQEDRQCNSIQSGKPSVRAPGKGI